jgi:transcriptional regulator with XRE-family HTH domain
MATRVDELFGQRVRERREAAGWSQARLGDELAKYDRDGKGLSQSAVARVEAGQRGVTIAEGRLFARALGATLDSLIVPNETFGEYLERSQRSLESSTRELEFARRDLEALEQSNAALREQVATARKLVRKHGADAEAVDY